jgi:hypothetical protein
VWSAPIASSNYTITVTVTDGRGGQAQASVTIAVDDIGPPPPASVLSAAAPRG